MERGETDDEERDEEVEENGEIPDCSVHLNAIECLLNSARRKGILDINEFDQAISAAERDDCISSADATLLRDTAQTAAPEPRDGEFDQIFEDLRLAIDMDEGAEEVPE